MLTFPPPKLQSREWSFRNISQPTKVACPPQKLKPFLKNRVTEFHQIRLSHRLPWQKPATTPKTHKQTLNNTRQQALRNTSAKHAQRTHDNLFRKLTTLAKAKAENGHTTLTSKNLLKVLNRQNLPCDATPGRHSLNVLVSLSQLGNSGQTRFEHCDQQKKDPG